MSTTDVCQCKRTVILTSDDSFSLWAAKNERIVCVLAFCMIRTGWFIYVMVVVVVWLIYSRTHKTIARTGDRHTNTSPLTHTMTMRSSMQKRTSAHCARRRWNEMRCNINTVKCKWKRDNYSNGLNFATELLWWMQLLFSINAEKRTRIKKQKWKYKKKWRKNICLVKFCVGNLALINSNSNSPTAYALFRSHSVFRSHFVLCVCLFSSPLLSPVLSLSLTQSPLASEYTLL